MIEAGQNDVPLMFITETLKSQSSDLYEILLGWTNKGNWNRWGWWHAWGRKEMHTGFE